MHLPLVVLFRQFRSPLTGSELDFFVVPVSNSEVGSTQFRRRRCRRDILTRLVRTDTQASRVTSNELLSPCVLPTATTMVSRVVQIDELATLIATYLVTISPRSAVALAQTCQCLEVPALRALWETQHSIKLLIHIVLQVDGYRYTSQAQSLFTTVSRFFSPLSDPACSVITKKTNRIWDDRSIRAS